MNFFNPYLYNAVPTVSKGLFSRLFGSIKLSGIISGASKTLNFVNQTIPMIKQVSPMVKNAKTMFKVLNEFKKSDNKNVNKNVNNLNINYDKEAETNDGPTFFI